MIVRPGKYSFPVAAGTLALCLSLAANAGVDQWCDTAESAQASLPAPPEALSVLRVDYGESNVLASRDDEAVPDDNAEITPYVPESALRIAERFQDDRAADSQSSGKAAESDARQPSIELRRSAPVAQDDRGEKNATKPIAPAGQVDARLPGVAPEDASRYRRQMYRTDI